ncbi:hypothetical protein IW261DRAFT_1342932 [Armillaria novae-zelandiae]|uniref:RuvB-like AAA-lid domain-containing protein n=1 Tax=Armillaria novae-zelandiae TaxID=153914 RepID=A0AA39U8A1_9AGAR|nr:hypothetical protein IW261DRAFT_1342932 [Armillaria novae-zelandiae]
MIEKSNRVNIWISSTDVTLTADTMNVLTSMAMQTSLRYSLNLISCAQMLAQK